jgi:uncharacterized Fe-S cluster protein YjdI
VLVFGTMDRGATHPRRECRPLFGARIGVLIRDLDAHVEFCISGVPGILCRYFSGKPWVDRVNGWSAKISWRVGTCSFGVLVCISGVRR